MARATDAASVRALWIARVARRFGCSMSDVRAMSLRDVDAMARVIQEEDTARGRQRQAQQAQQARRR